MSETVCPHCQSKKFSSAKVPKGVVTVMPCPECSELVVRFRNRAIALNKEVLYNGTKDERKMHLADVIAEFMEEGIFDIEMLQSPQFSRGEAIDNLEEVIEAIDASESKDSVPISDDELQRFIEFDLDKLDNVDYFRKNLE